MARILILIGGHFCTAPRPQKEAAALAMAGHEVMVAGVWFEPQLVARDQALRQAKSWQFQPVLDFRGITPGQKITRFKVRFQAKLARELFRRFGRCSIGLLGYGAAEMLQFAQSYHADLTIVHSEAGLWVGQRLQCQGYKVGVDFEDWFSADLLPTAQVNRPIAWIKSLESTLIQHCKYCLTTSQAMANAMAKAYNSTPPTVIYNTFPETNVLEITPEAIDRPNRQIPSLHWFSQTIGPGRGLEVLLAALAQVQGDWQLHLRGYCPDVYRTWLMAQVPDGWSDRVFIHGTVPNQELPLRIAEHDIGLALETTAIPSRNLTITNKLFQYLQAGLAVIATDTAGQREVLQSHPLAGQLIASDDPRSLAMAIDYWVQQPSQLAIAKQAAIAASKMLAWEPQANLLVRRAAAALSLPT
jgi:glycosyltransferase involved in cell wall biosynthesis